MNWSPEQFETMIDAIPAMAWSYLPDGACDFVNQRLRDYTGLSHQGAQVCSEWKSSLHRDDAEEFEKWWQGLQKSRKAGQTEFRLRRADGESRWFQISVTPVHDEQGRLIRWYGINTDIDDRKRAEQQLRRNEDELRTITDAIRQPIVVLAPDGATVYANRVALDNMGPALRDRISGDVLTRGPGHADADVRLGGLAWNQLQLWKLIGHPDDRDRIWAERQRGLSQGIPFELEARALHKTGQYRWQLFQYNPLKDEGGRIIRWYVTSTDIDDRKRKEDQLRNENLVLREEIDRSSMFEEIVGSSQALRRVLSDVAKVAPTDSTVLVQGETGTGKELIARAIHKRSNRSAQAFIRVNCAAIPQSLIASELFGHEKGAFTGAIQRRLGRFESANGGTIFLDEIGELSAEIQASLLRVLQEHEIERVGSSQSIPLDVRVIAATNRDLKAAVDSGAFREDLFYRLNVFPIQVPSLRQRVDDIPLLLEYLIDRYAKKSGKKIRRVDKGTLELFQSYDWPGNIRELQNVVERGVILCDGDTFSVNEAWLDRQSPLPGKPSVTLAATIEAQERSIIEAALEACGGRVAGPTGAARKLGIPRQTLESKIASLDIDKHLFKSAQHKLAYH